MSGRRGERACYRIDERWFEGLPRVGAYDEMRSHVLAAGFHRMEDGKWLEPDELSDRLDLLRGCARYLTNPVTCKIIAETIEASLEYYASVLPRLRKAKRLRTEEVFDNVVAMFRSYYFRLDDSLAVVSNSGVQIALVPAMLYAVVGASHDRDALASARTRRMWRYNMASRLYDMSMYYGSELLDRVEKTFFATGRISRLLVAVPPDAYERLAAADVSARLATLLRRECDNWFRDWFLSSDADMDVSGETLALARHFLQSHQRSAAEQAD